MDASTCIAIVKDSANVVFFVIVGTVTILAYRRARATLLAPMKNEVFKVQLKELSDIFAFLRSIDKRDAFDFASIVEINASALLYAYSHNRFPNQIKYNEEFLEQVRSKTAGMLALPEALELPPPLERDDDTPPAPQPWSEYRQKVVHFTRKHADSVEELERLTNSPFVTAELRRRLEAIAEAVHQNLALVRVTLTEAASELPTHYPASNDLIRANTSWIHNMYNAKRIQTTPLIEDTIGFISEYLEPDQLWEQR